MKAPIEGGYIYLAKSLLDSDIWFCSSNTIKVAIYLLLSATFSDNERKNLKRGQCWKTLGIISEDCNISIKAVRCALDRLKNIDFIQSQGAHKGARSGQRLTICNYSKFQDVHNYGGAGQGHGKGHSKGQAKGQHYNEGNEGNEEIVKTFKKYSEDDFRKEVWTFKEKYSQDMLGDFFRHWSELDPAGKKMAFQLKQTWQTGKRLATWNKNNFGNKHSVERGPTQAELEFIANEGNN